jgi:hypothetical protein
MIIRSVRRQKMTTMPVYKAIMERTNYVRRFAGFRQLKEEIWSSTIMTQCGTWQARLLKQLGFERKGSKNL